MAETLRHDDTPEPVRGHDGAPIMGPRNVALERQNPDLVAAAATDHGTIPNLKFSFAAAHNRLQSGGWAREVTVRELPIATELAGVNMRLRPGAIREMHCYSHRLLAQDPVETAGGRVRTMEALSKDKPIVVPSA